MSDDIDSGVTGKENTPAQSQERKLMATKIYQTFGGN